MPEKIVRLIADKDALLELDGLQLELDVAYGKGRIRVTEYKDE